MPALAVGAIAALVVLMASAAQAQAEGPCQCAELDPETAVARAQAVFEGTVDAISEPRDGHREVTLAVTRSWKGVSHERVRVAIEIAAEACGFAFTAGHTYLVLTSAPTAAGGLPSVAKCSGTQPIEEADAILAGLGAGVIPVAPRPEGDAKVLPEPLAPPPAQAGCASCRIGRRAADGERSGRPWALTLIALIGLARLPRLARRRRAA